jgi:serine/threonine protein kinase
VDKKRWQRIQKLFERAQSMAPAERDAFLAEHSSDDVSIADEVRSMLDGIPPSQFLNAPNNMPPEDSYSGGGLVGLKMGEFELIEEIGHGGMGVVYRAHQPGLERDVAVKILPKIRTGDEQALERFRREAKAASNLNHPNVVPIMSVGESHGMAWYAMALIEGPDLGAFIHDLKSGSASAEAIFGKFGTHDYFRNLAAAFAQVCDAVHYAHQSGVIHRDIKPANILLDSSGKLLLTDFGLAKDERFGAMSVSGQLHGTPHYMSPEQAKASKGAVDHRTDIYSLSVVLYELLCLRRPFDGGSIIDVLEDIASGDPPSVRKISKSIPRDLSILVEKGMRKAASDRFADAGDLAADLRRFSRGERILTPALTFTEQVLRLYFRYRRKVQGLAAILIAMAGSIWGKSAWEDYQAKVPVLVLLEGEGWVAHVYEIEIPSGKLTEVTREITNFRVRPGYRKLSITLRHPLVLINEQSRLQFLRLINPNSIRQNRRLRNPFNKAFWIDAVGALQHFVALPPKLLRFARVHRRWRHQANPTVPMLVVVPVHKCSHKITRLLQG